MALITIESEGGESGFDSAYTLIIDNLGGQALYIGGKIVFIGVGSFNLPCIRDIVTLSHIDDEILNLNSIEELREFIVGGICSQVSL